MKGFSLCVLLALTAADLTHGASAGATAPTNSPPGARTNAPAATLLARQVVARTKHTKTIETLRQVTSSNAAGAIVLQTNRSTYHVIKNGMNRRDSVSGQWVECQPNLEIQPDGTIRGTGANSSVVIQGNLAAAGCIDLTTPDQQRIRMSLLSLSWYDPDSGRMQTIGIVSNSVAEVGSNTVTFRRAFDRVNASVVYRYEAGQFAQWVVLEERIAPPADFGPRTRLEATTEILEASALAKTTKVLQRARRTRRCGPNPWNPI